MPSWLGRPERFIHSATRSGGKQQFAKLQLVLWRTYKDLPLFVFFLAALKMKWFMFCFRAGAVREKALNMYSILSRGSFCFNYCLNSAWHGGDQFVALLRWYGSPGFFDSGLQLICIVGSGVSHLPLDNTP